ncbi:proton channel OtopLc [Papilio machaon]|uniref:proton channel OtopLc n=1 Tax=Papilio machaon TaxID=76193 RepID=UPI001E665EF9|nr:proton channel OtopLc [Papilio machaon]
MADPKVAHKEVMEEIVNRKKLGDKKSHSETSLQNLEDIDESVVTDAGKDPGVVNKTLNVVTNEDDGGDRRRTMSTPGPVSGSLLTATAARAARRRPPRSVMYAPDLERTDSTSKRDDDSILGTPIGERNSASPVLYNGNIRNNGDVKSLSSYRVYNTLNDVRGGTTPRKRSVTTMDAQSLRSLDTQAPPPTSPEDNKRLTLKYMTLILSGMYAILLVTLGVIFNLADPFVDMHLATIYSLVLTGVGFLYVMYLLFDIARYKGNALKNQKAKEIHEEKLSEYYRKREEEFGPIVAGDRTPDSYRSLKIPSALLVSLKHDYCFSQGRHSGSFYLKLGAAGFALGHLVHSVLLITLQANYYLDDNINNQDCVDVLRLVLDVVNPLYSFVQLYFIFKYSNVIILRGQGLAHFGFMHMIGSSLCFWIATIVRETVLALTLYANSKYGNRTNGYEAEINLDPVFTSAESRIFDISNLYNEHCQGSGAISSVFESVSPYLYPFSVEFNILIVAVYYIIWSNVGHCENADGDKSESNSSLGENYSICKIPTANEENDYTSNMVIYADCHASNRGLFVGLIIIVIVLGMLIVGFVFSSVGDNFLEVGYLLNYCTKLGLHVIMLFAAVIAYNQTIKLDINEHPISLLDDVLLFICLPAFFLESVLSLAATVSVQNIIKSVDFVVMVVQVIIQTFLLVDGLRRCSNSRKLRRTKPGRELMMFMIIANVAMWLHYSFSYKSPDSLDERYEFYGKILWSILGHISLPLIMFYRFHSSVCFADIWNSAYKPGSDH